jgi:hypothetical protein
MALIRSLERKSMDRNSIHREIRATYTLFECDGRRFIQLDSYGTDERQIPGKKSQSLQFDDAGARALFDILKRHFDFH